ncbi:MAG: LytTR family DNA-binding domain-containing protein [Ferrovibrio sp.]|uniref:LytTR family DNA-binding domain-containing protein n=1 Tax=Ferrovibrio sp. TaxID=1917215 RepID=UPI0039195E97
MTAPVTNGGPDGMNGGLDATPEIRAFRFPAWMWVAYAAILLTVAALVGSSYWIEAGRVGLDIPLWHIVVNELTSIVIVFAVTPAVFTWTARLDPRRIGWPRVLLGHGAGMIAFGVAHIGGMTVLRLALYPLFGGSYELGDDPLVTGLVYEGRKDALAYIAMAVGAWLLAMAMRKPVTIVEQVAPTSLPATRRLEIRDGARRVWLDPAEILWAEAAGNYVELHLAGRSWLQRQTLAALEEELADQGFVRIHRSRLVNRHRVRDIISNDSGDFTVTLDDGRQIAGGRRWRDTLLQSG